MARTKEVFAQMQQELQQTAQYWAAIQELIISITDAEGEKKQFKIKADNFSGGRRDTNSVEGNPGNSEAHD